MNVGLDPNPINSVSGMQRLTSWLWTGAKYLANTSIARMAIATSLKSMGYLQSVGSEQIEATGKKITLTDVQFEAEVCFRRFHVSQLIGYLLFAIYTR